MLLLASTSDILRIVTSSNATVDVHASWIDNNSGTITPGRTNTAISSATTTTVVGSPAASTYRNIKTLVIRNKSVSTAVTIEVQHFDGSTSVELDKRVLSPGATLQFIDGVGWVSPVQGGNGVPPWSGVVAGAMRDGDPGFLMFMVQRAGWIGPTPTNIGATVARCAAFMLPAAMTVNRIRFYGIGAVASIYTVALYRYSDLARLSASLTLSTTANTWGSVGSTLGISLAANTVYFIACSANTTGTVAGLAAFGTTTTATTGQIQSTPAALPGSLALGGGYLNSYQFQFAVTAGAMPNPAATLALPAAWTGGMPAFWLDSADV